MIKLLAGLLFAAIALAPNASADPMIDQIYSDHLAERGIVLDTAKSNNLGRAVCKDLRGGATPIEVMTMLHREANVTLGQAGWIVGGARAAYCPEVQD
jgi:hypothetical protein